jgi:5-hydroxyisourate hydrolase-like protein (transthyretin family)
MRHRSRLPSLLGLLVVSGLLAGCAGSTKPAQPVRGRVIAAGKPVANAQVTFHPLNDDREAPRPAGVTDKDGYFTLTSYSKSDGAPEGEYAVTVACFQSFPTRNQSEGDETTRNVLPSRYSNPTTSQLRATVGKGKNELPPLEVSLR